MSSFRLSQQSRELAVLVSMATMVWVFGDGGESRSQTVNSTVEVKQSKSQNVNGE